MNATPQSEPQAQSNPRTWKLTLAYDGTDYSGWQVQPGQLTIQGELQAALGRITGEAPLPQGSGRTDAGVHALAQVASFVLRAAIPAENLQRALNRTLPAAIRVVEAKIVPHAFHARHSTVAKTYEYRVFLERPQHGSLVSSQAALCTPFLARYVYGYPWPMAFEALEIAAKAFIGTYDFLSFAATDPDLTQRGLDQDADSNPETAASPGEDSPAPAAVESPKTEVPERKALETEAPVKGTGFSPYIKPDAPGGASAPEGHLSAGSVRTIFSSAWEQRQVEGGTLLVYRVRGSGFLHHMVRNLVGTMLDVGRGYRNAAEIPAIISARSRAAAGPTAPARGLFLHSVEYRSGSQG